MILAPIRPIGSERQSKMADKRNPVNGLTESIIRITHLAIGDCFYDRGDTCRVSVEPSTIDDKVWVHYHKWLPAFGFGSIAYSSEYDIKSMVTLVRNPDNG